MLGREQGAVEFVTCQKSPPRPKQMLQRMLHLDRRSHNGLNGCVSFDNHPKRGK